MGYDRQHTIVVTSWDRERAEAALAEANRIGCHTSTLVEGMVNGQWSFFVAPDGSKEGWADSRVGDEQRAALIEWLEGQRYDDRSTSIDWCHVQFGDDDGYDGLLGSSASDYENAALLS